ncbi:MAG: M20 family peptidase [Verrucomicrobia bacterium]|nr:MAG: M20 family peptidase [Verrucomicrobiota bacterium]
MQTDDATIRRRVVALTRDLILIPSIPSRPDDRRRCYEFVKNHLEVENGVEISEYEDRGIPSLVATASGCQEPDILMCAHLDVITHPDIAFYRSEIRDGRIIGPGAGDMKGTLAIMMELFREIHQRTPGVSLGLAVTSDEETGGESGIGFLFRQCGLRCGNAMIPDGGSLNEITIDEKGILHMKLRCHGHPAHAARPWLGDNPIEKLMFGLEQLTELFGTWKDASGYWHPTCAITVIGTENETVNRIPADAFAHLDVRFPPPHSVDTMLGRIRGCLGPDIESEVMVCAEPTHLSPDPVYREVTEQITGREARLVRDSGGSDARFICQTGIPVQMSRPLVGNLHADDEWIEIDSMVQFYRICETYIKRKLSDRE